MPKKLPKTGEVLMDVRIALAEIWASLENPECVEVRVSKAGNKQLNVTPVTETTLDQEAQRYRSMIHGLFAGMNADVKLAYLAMMFVLSDIAGNCNLSKEELLHDLEVTFNQVYELGSAAKQGTN